VVSSTDLSAFGGKATLSETTNHGPALAFGNGKLFLAWNGLDQRLMVSSSADGVTFTPAVRLAHTSSTSPGLLFANGKLFLVWRGTDAGGHLNVIDSADGVTLANKVTLPEASAFRPALASVDGLYFVWTGLVPGRNINVRVGATPATLANKQTFSDGSQASPALVAFTGSLRLSWSGTDAPAHLNLAILSSQDEPSLGDSFVKLTPNLSLSDWFSPWNTQHLNAADNDLGSGGILLLPGTSLLVGGGKEGKLYLLDVVHLGHVCATCHDPAGDTQIVQWFQATGTSRGNNAASPRHASHPWLSGVLEQPQRRPSNLCLGGSGLAPCFPVQRRHIRRCAGGHQRRHDAAEQHAGGHALDIGAGRPGRDGHHLGGPSHPRQRQPGRRRRDDAGDRCRQPQAGALEQHLESCRCRRQAGQVHTTHRGKWQGLRGHVLREKCVSTAFWVDAQKSARARGCGSSEGTSPNVLSRGGPLRVL